MDEVQKLRRALQKIADLPLDGPIDVSIRARRIALAALGATRESVERVGDSVRVFIPCAGLQGAKVIGDKKVSSLLEFDWSKRHET